MAILSQSDMMRRPNETDAQRLDRLAWQQRLAEIDRERRQALRRERWHKFLSLFKWRR